MEMVVILVKTPGLFTNTMVPPSYRCFILNLALIDQAVSEKIIVIYMYIAPGRGQTSPRSNFFQNHKS